MEPEDPVPFTQDAKPRVERVGKGANPPYTMSQSQSHNYATRILFLRLLIEHLTLGTQAV
jgi:hypothetical protein